MFSFLRSKKSSNPPELFELSARIFAHLEFEGSRNELAELVLESFTSTLKPDIGCIYFLPENGSEFAVAAREPRSFWQNSKNLENFASRPLNTGGLGSVLKSGSWRLINDPEQAEQEGLYVPFSDEIRSELLVPLQTRDLFGRGARVTGVIVASWRRSIGEIDPRQLEFLMRLLGIVFSTALTREHRDTRLALLRGLAELDPANTDQLLTSFLEVLDATIPSHFMSLWLYDEEADRLALRAFSPRAIGRTQITLQDFDRPVLRPDECVCGRVIKEKSAILFREIPNGYANPRLAQELGLKWLVSLPLRSSSEFPMAVLNIYPKSSPDEFDDDKFLDVLVSYVSPVASAIRLSHLLFQESNLRSFGALLGKCLDIDDSREWWDGLASDLRTAMNCEGCSIFLASGSDELMLKGSTGIEGDPLYSDVVYPTDPKDSLTAYAYSLGKSFIYYRGDPTSVASKVHKSLFREKTSGKSRSILFVPLRSGTSTSIGIIRCNNKDERPGRGVGVFSSEDRSHLEKVAALVSAAYLRTIWMRDRSRERDRATRAIQHELLGPVQALKDHGGWLYRWNRLSSEERESRLPLVVADMARHTDLIDLAYSSLGQFDDLHLTVRKNRLSQIIAACRRFLHVEREIRWVELRTGSIGVDYVLCDELQMMRVMFNLLRNAVKYRDRRATTRYVSIRAYQEEEYVVVEVEDNGIGVIAGEEELIFEPERRGSNAKPHHPSGEGLGLHFCRAIVNAHGGRISVVNCRQPTIFRLEWPGIPGERGGE